MKQTILDWLGMTEAEIHPNVDWKRLEEYYEIGHRALAARYARGYIQ
jgi:hypothetical protein